MDLPVDRLIHVTSLSDDYYYLESETHTLIGRRSARRYLLGDKVSVRDCAHRRRPAVTGPGPGGSHIPCARRARRDRCT